jgi:hypothetical protein
MNSSAEVNMEFGGQFTYTMFSGTNTTAGPCLPNGNGSNQVRCRPFSACPPLQTNGHTCVGSQPAFKVFEDDIIFLKR